ncbi:glycerophosphodiester phosphodiesterase [Caulobacter segnis]|uniref:Glycerophosphoryl diester phosphodiesterase n=2 Tax=Caulobacter segnis TaxID=88688 RepID=D5VHN1_CAUST|nr:glycerophosphodiester phosphodiesterase family protein [Caulobacter segnis]ADG09012.1 glycerophosphoryl diester phosphodiesterase [Caulobacter segnis ATCC 21756]AVQ00843.1 glycerophosphodiester phosphodiesterase [Caulobacter segnis]
MMHRLALGVLLCLMAAAAAWGAPPPERCAETPAMTAALARLARPEAGLMIAAHRGVHSQAPENSLAAIEAAIAAGADIVEIDVAVTTDGTPVLMHDRTVERTTTGQGPVEGKTASEIADLRLKGRDGRASNEPPPTLARALALACGRILVDLDLKSDRLGPIVETVNASGMRATSLYFDSDPAVLANVRALDPAARLMVRLTTDVSLADLLAITGPAAVAHADIESLTPTARGAIARLGLRVWLNSLGEADQRITRGDNKGVEDLLSMGGSVLQTDEVAALVALRRARLGGNPGAEAPSHQAQPGSLR